MVEILVLDLEEYYEDDLVVQIDDELIEIDKVHDYGYLPMLSLGQNLDYYIAKSQEDAGIKARKYWKEMADDDPGEFTYIVGESTLIAWALGKSAGPGYTKVTSLEEWLDLFLGCPEEVWGSYDSAELDIQGISTGLLEELGWKDVIESPSLYNLVVYRHN